MYKLGLEKTEEPEIKLPTFAGSSKKAREFQKKRKKKSTSALLTRSKIRSKTLTEWITTNCVKF